MGYARKSTRPQQTKRCEKTYPEAQFRFGPCGSPPNAMATGKRGLGWEGGGPPGLLRSSRDLGPPTWRSAVNSRIPRKNWTVEASSRVRPSLAEPPCSDVLRAARQRLRLAVITPSVERRAPCSCSYNYSLYEQVIPLQRETDLVLAHKPSPVPYHSFTESFSHLADHRYTIPKPLQQSPAGNNCSNSSSPSPPAAQQRC